MQIIKGNEYKQISASKEEITVTEKSPRGEIRDRYGRLLAGNRPSYCLSLIKTEMEDKELNSAILWVLNILKADGNDYLDNLPADADIACLAEKYNIFGYTSEDVRRIAGVRHDANESGFSAACPFVMDEDVSVSVVSQIKESYDLFPCFRVSNNFVRDYYNDGYASHIIGRIGKISSEEYKEKKSSGYKINDVIGKQGIEKTAEEYLRYKDGENNKGLPGNSVILTIDIEMQKVLEDSLKKMITKISSVGGRKTGADANSGAAVVIDVRNGDVLACASYPSYNLSTFREDYNALAADENLPLLNRAVSGTYSPGSTFKPLVALAALQNNKIEPDETINDQGIYSVYDDYRPRCWIWLENNATHGNINVSTAIEQSCNYFFYEAGRRTGIDIISEYSSKFGLGEYTGTGLPEETKGCVANPKTKKKVIGSPAGEIWYPADTLQASIGQSINTFTPLQLANYIATLANGGKRYKLNIIKSIRSGTDGSLVNETEPEVAEEIEIDSEHLSAVLYGMKNVVEEGSAKSIFSGYPISMGGKTGTAQLGVNVSNNALFTAFAPFDNPEIAVCVVIEHGVRGANAAYVAKDLFDYYFDLNVDSQEAFNIVNNLD